MMSGLLVQFVVSVLKWSAGPILVAGLLGSKIGRRPLQSGRVSSGALGFFVGILSAQLAAFLVLVFVRNGPPWIRCITVACLVGSYVAFCVARVREPG